MKVDENKLNRQLEGIGKWRGNGGIGTFHWPTGMGKTYAGCIVINTICTARDKGKVKVQVPSTELFKQWTGEVGHLVEERFRERVEVTTVQSQIRASGKEEVLLLIADEIHEYATPEYLKTIDGTMIKYEFILGLTATWSRPDLGHYELQDLAPVVDTITIQEAIQNGWVSKFIEYNIAVPLTTEEEKRYRYLSEIIGELLPRFNGNLKVASACTHGGKFTDGDGIEHLMSGFQYAAYWATHKGWRSNLNLNNPDEYDIENMWNPRLIMGYGKELFTCIRERKDILYNARNKVSVTMEILKKFDTQKTICFSQSTGFADLIGERYKDEIGEDVVVYHTKLKSRPLKDKSGQFITYKSGAKTGQIKYFGAKVLKDRAIEAIRSGQARLISTAAALDRGLDVKDIRLGIITSGSQNPIQQQQRNGRVMRIESYEEDIIVLLINLYVPNTKDQTWLEKRQSQSRNLRFWVNGVNEVNYTPRKHKTETV